VTCALVGDVTHVVRIETFRAPPVNLGVFHDVLRGRPDPIGLLRLLRPD
jgi:hypothetical protein